MEPKFEEYCGIEDPGRNDPGTQPKRSNIEHGCDRSKPYQTLKVRQRGPQKRHMNAGIMSHRLQVPVPNVASINWDLTVQRERWVVISQ